MSFCRVSFTKEDLEILSKYDEDGLILLNNQIIPLKTMNYISNLLRHYYKLESEKETTIDL